MIASEDTLITLKTIFFGISGTLLGLFNHIFLFDLNVLLVKLNIAEYNEHIIVYGHLFGTIAGALTCIYILVKIAERIIQLFKK